MLTLFGSALLALCFREGFSASFKCLPRAERRFFVMFDCLAIEIILLVAGCLMSLWLYSYLILIQLVIGIQFVSIVVMYLYYKQRDATLVHQYLKAIAHCRFNWHQEPYFIKIAEELGGFETLQNACLLTMGQLSYYN